MYLKCESCGFVISKTHFELSKDRWENLNKEYHDAYLDSNCNPDDPKWADRLKAQAGVIDDLTKLGLIPADMPWIDFGCGDGKLSDLLQADYGQRLLKFDHYMSGSDYLSEDELKDTRFGFVITTSVLEHLRSREELDRIASLGTEKSVMGINTFVTEEIPGSPEWFYLLPVHCSFFSNRSMQILFEEWGFSSSIYHVDSRLWLWFKTDIDRTEKIILSANRQKGREKYYYHFKRGFMDYWKLDQEKILLRAP